MSSTFRAYAELFRVFLTPSAVADSFAGYMLVWSLKDQPAGRPAPEILLVAVASACLYWLGMATNDIFDVEKDRHGAPRRPLPSGSVDLVGAWTAANVLALIALVLGFHLDAGLPVTGIIVLALAYNSGAKRLPVVGNILMGGCRAGNFLLGAAASGRGLSYALAEPAILIAALALGVYVAGVTAVSRREDRKPSPGVFRALTLPLLLVPLALALLHPDSLWNWVNSGALAGLIIAAIASAARGPAPGPSATIFVRRSLAGIFLVDAGALWAFTPPEADPFSKALVLYLLLALGWLWKHVWLQSGGADT